MVDVEINDENEAPLISIRVLKLIKDAQQKHGLRYGNYQRYAYVSLKKKVFRCI